MTLVQHAPRFTVEDAAAIARDCFGFAVSANVRALAAALGARPELLAARRPGAAGGAQDRQCAGGVRTAGGTERGAAACGSARRRGAVPAAAGGARRKHDRGRDGSGRAQALGAAAELHRGHAAGPRQAARRGAAGRPGRIYGAAGWRAGGLRSPCPASHLSLGCGAGGERHRAVQGRDRRPPAAGADRAAVRGTLRRRRCQDSGDCATPSSTATPTTTTCSCATGR